MISSNTIGINEFLECGTLYSEANFKRRYKITAKTDDDTEAESYFRYAVENGIIKQEEKDAFCYECEKQSKPKPEKKTPTGGNEIESTEDMKQSNGKATVLEDINPDPVFNTIFEAEQRVKRQKVDVLAALLNQIEPVDFAERAGQDPDEKLSYKHLAVLICEEIAKLAITNNWSLCKKDGFFWIFDGTHYYKVEDAELEAFLGKSAEKMGLGLEARTFGFRETLRKQFASSGYLPPLAEPNAIPKINLANGTLIFPHNDKPQLKDFDRNDFIPYQLPFPYQPGVDCPVFRKFLNEVLPDPDAQKVLCEMLAYVFVKASHLKLEKCLLLYGFGANGKSVVFEVFTALLGEENTTNYSLSSLCDTNGYYRALLAGKLVNYAAEISGDLNSQIFKTLASGEPCDARLPYKEPFLLKEYGKLIFNSNVLPNAPEHTHGFFRRFCIIPFEVTIPEEKQDKDLANKIIRNELPGVLNWLIEGLERLLKNRKLTHSAKINEQTEKFKKESDSVALFIDDLAEEGFAKDDKAEVAFKELYQGYSSWSKNSGYKALSKRKFGERIRALGYKVDKNSDLGMYVYGIGSKKTASENMYF